jgi:hypothetical protein
MNEWNRANMIPPKMKYIFLLPGIVLGSAGIWSALSFDDHSGLFAFIIGFAVGAGFIGLYVPQMREQFKAGKQSTPEQRKQGLGRVRVWVVLLGLIISAIFRNYFRDLWLHAVIFILGFLTSIILVIGWLRYEFEKRKERRQG